MAEIYRNTPMDKKNGVIKADFDYIQNNERYSVDFETYATNVIREWNSVPFVFSIKGAFDDQKMEMFNSLPHEDCEEKVHLLQDFDCEVDFLGVGSSIVKKNLIMCGIEMETILAGMVRLFYFVNREGPTTMYDAITYLSDMDIAGYKFDSLEDLRETYYLRIAEFLDSIFTGMTASKKWTDKKSVAFGKVVVCDDELCTSFSINDWEFKEFLVSKLKMEAPSHKRHKDMVIYKEDGRYLLKLGLQLRFVLNR